MDNVRSMMNAPDIHQALLCEHIARDLQAAIAVEEDVPFVRIAQSHQIRRQERGCWNFSGPIERERIHRFEHTVLDAVDQLEIANDFLGRKGLELKFPPGLFLDAVGPGLKCVEPNASRPRGLHFPSRRCRGLRVADVRSSDCAARQSAYAGFQQRSACWILASKLISVHGFPPRILCSFRDLRSLPSGYGHQTSDESITKLPGHETRRRGSVSQIVHDIAISRTDLILCFRYEVSTFRPALAASERRDFFTAP